MKRTPEINGKYWISLIFASIFGANMGDFLADGLDFGHLSGLPLLATILAGIFIAEHFDRNAKMFYYWAAIITIRAAATNIGDIFHDFDLSFALSVPISFAGLALAVLAWYLFNPDSLRNRTVPVNNFYWVSMFFAGVLGTVAGDATSYALDFGNFYAMLSLGAILAVMLLFGKGGLQTQLVYYWLTIAMIRSAGTAAGDMFAHAVFGLQLSTEITGLVFVAVTYLLYSSKPHQAILKSHP